MSAIVSLNGQSHQNTVDLPYLSIHLVYNNFLATHTSHSAEHLLFCLNRFYFSDKMFFMSALIEVSKSIFAGKIHSFNLHSYLPWNWQTLCFHLSQMLPCTDLTAANIQHSFHEWVKYTHPTAHEIITASNLIGYLLVLLSPVNARPSCTHNALEVPSNERLENQLDISVWQQNKAARNLALSTCLFVQDIQTIHFILKTLIEMDHPGVLFTGFSWAQKVEMRHLDVLRKIIGQARSVDLYIPGLLAELLQARNLHTQYRFELFLASFSRLDTKPIHLANLTKLLEGFCVLLEQAGILGRAFDHVRFVNMYELIVTKASYFKEVHDETFDLATLTRTISPTVGILSEAIVAHCRTIESHLKIAPENSKVGAIRVHLVYMFVRYSHYLAGKFKKDPKELFLTLKNRAILEAAFQYRQIHALFDRNIAFYHLRSLCETTCSENKREIKVNVSTEGRLVFRGRP